MKIAFVLASLVTVAAFVFASSASSQEPALDLGEVTPLVAACAHLKVVGESGGLLVKNCRRAAPDEIVGNRALIHVRVATDVGPFELQVEMRKSLWHTVLWR